MIFRVEKNENYTVMSNYHLREKEMSLKAKGLLSWMLSNNDDWDYSIAGIVKNCKENETAIKTALDELKTFGYLEVKKILPTKEIPTIHYEYIVHEQPVNSADNQDIDFLGVDNLAVENQVQRNTKTSNTKRKEKSISKDISWFDSTTERKSKKKNLYQQCSECIDEYTNNVRLNGLLHDYLTLRLAMKDKPIYGVNQWKGLLNKLDELCKEKNIPDKIVSYSIERGYASFFMPGSYSKSTVKSNPTEKGVTSQHETEEEYNKRMASAEKRKKAGEQAVF